jgi:hypothetical protein
LEGGFGDGFGALVGEGFQNGLGAVRAGFEQDGQGVFHGIEAVIAVTGVAVDAIEKRGEVEQFVAGLDELEIEKIFFTRHDWNIGTEGPAVNLEEWGSRLAWGVGMV